MSEPGTDNTRTEESERGSERPGSAVTPGINEHFRRHSSSTPPEGPSYGPLETPEAVTPPPLSNQTQAVDSSACCNANSQSPQSPRFEATSHSLPPAQLQGSLRSYNEPLQDDDSQLSGGHTYVPRDNLLDHSTASPLNLYEEPLGEDEAKLLKHFFAILLPWVSLFLSLSPIDKGVCFLIIQFDYLWETGPFQSFIRQALHSDAGILYAVLAVAARHLEATGGSIYSRSNEYEQKCLNILIPTLNSRKIEQLQGDGVLVSALLLRLLDEMTGRSCFLLV